MPLSFIDVLDSAVKIGLGAAITAIATYATTKLGHANDRNKDIRSHKLKTQELISDKCDSYFSSYLGLHYRGGGIRAHKGTSEEFPFTDAYHASLKEVDGAFQQAIPGLQSA